MKLNKLKKHTLVILLNILCVIAFLCIIYMLGPCDAEIVADIVYLPDCNCAGCDWLRWSVPENDIVVLVGPNDPRISALNKCTK